MKSGKILVIAGCCLALFQQDGTAQERNAFSGDIGFGIMTISRADNLDPNGSKKYLATLDKGAERELSIMPIIVPRLFYDVGEPGGLVLQGFIRPPIEEAGGLVINAGGSYSLAEQGAIVFGAFIAPLEEAWEDPYLVNERRCTTANPKYGVHLGWQQLMGSGWGVRGVYLQDRIDNDRAGSRYPDLDRDGALYALQVEYAYPVTQSLEVKPKATVVQGVYDGDSNSFIRYKIELGARYVVGKWHLTPSVSYRYTDYDKVNPVFGKTREEDSYSVDLMVLYVAPFNRPDWFVQGLAGYGKGENAIAFYETESIRVGAMIGYRF